MKNIMTSAAIALGMVLVSSSAFAAVPINVPEPMSLSLLAGGIESTLKIGCTIIDAMIIDKVGRRLTMAGGAGIMALGMLINGALPLAYPNNSNRVSDYTCIVFIFIYSFGYSMGFGPAAWVYGSEIFPQSLRARGLNFAASGGSIGSIVVTQVWPVGIDKIGSKIYFFFMAINLACVPIIYIFYPETKGRALEDMDTLFGRAAAVQYAHDDLDLVDDPPPGRRSPLPADRQTTDQPKVV